MKKAYLTTLGCKVNQFETAAFKSELEQGGVAITADIEEADFIIINTCTVTSKAGGESRREVKKALRQNMQATVVVTGCHAQLEQEELSSLPEVNPGRLVVAGNDRKDNLISELIEGPPDRFETRDENIFSVTDIAPLHVNRFEGRTRAYLRVQDGCESFCSYCIVPYSRGKSRSLPIEAVLNQTSDYVDSGHREIVITGIHVGRYGLDLSADCNITALLDRVCHRFPGIRFRLSSIEPLEIDDNLLALMAATGNLMPHLHIPLQSGDNEILRNMNRRYSREQFTAVVHKCRTTLPEAAIGFDVMVGFPGETEKMFDNTRELIESLDYTYLHVFPFSSRPGTRAAEFEDQVDDLVKHQRAETLRRLGRKKSRAFYRRFINSRRKALLETENISTDRLKGYSDNYIPIVTDKPDKLPTESVMVELVEITGNSVRVQIV